VIGVDPVRGDVLEFGQAAELGNRRGIIEQILGKAIFAGPEMSSGWM
jgi:hypothetical protein